MILTASDIAVLTAQQSALLSHRLDDEGRVRQILTALSSLIGAQRSFAAFTLGAQFRFINNGAGPQIEAYLARVFRGFDRNGNALMCDPELEEINLRRRQMGPGVHHEAKLQLRERIEASAYFKEAFAPAGMHHVIGLTAPLPIGEAVFAFGFDGDDDPGFAGTRAVDLLRLVLPAFQAGFTAWDARATAQQELEAALASAPDMRLVTHAAPETTEAIRVIPGPPLPGYNRSWITFETNFATRPETRARAAARHGLTARQTEVMGLMLEGLTSARIAERLGISPHTARRHCEAVLSRLGIRSRAAIWSALSGNREA
ncbi:helix-turn-helix transcriptional regulator [Loktanella sp. SALINAS62]|uniref:response regulator transcription factor n=1 Tax=Loktanella sp. SALINAS62 TaxID=2706124 RepID=UPI001B8BF8C7|nr:helix-turn-helix transcriptional regulator [Loktanella sp. SALINAS62]MBS1303397.1 helix-turn-helix transcriptional regulator [Loktanella sp. SALINAS62]